MTSQVFVGYRLCFHANILLQFLAVFGAFDFENQTLLRLFPCLKSSLLFAKPVFTLSASVDSATANVVREMSVCHPQLSPMTSRPPNLSRQPAKGISALSAAVTLTLHTVF